MQNIDHLEIQEVNEDPRKITHIGLIIDESSSMEDMKEVAISLFNENIGTIKKEEENNSLIKNYVTVVKFSSDVDFLFKNVSPLSIEKIDNNNYSPSGMTAMYDAIGETIDLFKSLEDYKNPNVSFLLLIITDGNENRSKKHTGEILSKEIKSLTETNRWTFTVLGANIDLNDLKDKLNIPVGNVQRFHYSNRGINIGSANMSQGISSYLSARTSGLRSTEAFYSRNEESPRSLNPMVEIVDNANIQARELLAQQPDRQVGDSFFSSLIEEIDRIQESNIGSSIES